MHTNNLDVIYFVQSENDQAIKIGHSTLGGLKSRVSELQIGNHQKMTLLGIEIGDRSHERRLHLRFKRDRIRGEWFKPAKALLAYIADHARPIEIVSPHRKNANSSPIATGQPAFLMPGFDGWTVVGTGTTGKVRLTGQTLRAFRAIRSSRDVRHAIGLSLADMAGRSNGATGRAYARQTIANYESPARRVYDTIFHGKRPKYKMPDDVIAVYRSSLAEAVTLATAGAIDVRIAISKRGLWRVDPIMRCAICDQPFTVKRANVTRCNWCIKHNQTRRKAKGIKHG